ncbi:hypothetical protein L873DRAFT_1709157 [Choiromyces venosus 120613-1]|uniref:Uncharacterized protein n=1 Tax=Choiromyces venosus 120613-1 TaxID=1336337 RepID=A0A3N4J7J8_9PEZI|nr:hypothetical protein L873DRAFT_1709157 [Choiromyces venosus 120613-1]
MSSQKPGRQSPPPEYQSGAQTGTPSGGKAREKQAYKRTDQSLGGQTGGLSSNPVGPLDQAAKDKAAKPGEKSLDGL